MKMFNYRSQVGSWRKTNQEIGTSNTTLRSPMAIQSPKTPFKTVIPNGQQFRLPLNLDLIVLLWIWFVSLHVQITIKSPV